MYTYNGVTIIGRYTAALLDIFVIGLFIKAAALISEKKQQKLSSFFAGLFYACMTLPIQLSHYYAVDSYLTTCLMIVWVLILLPPSLITTTAIGLFFGLAVSAKISAIYSLPAIACALFIQSIPLSWKQRVYLGIAGILVTIGTIRISFPYFFIHAKNIFKTGINPHILENFAQLKMFDTPGNWFPPATMWSVTKPYIYPFESLSTWGIGIPLSIILIIGCFILIRKHRTLLIAFLFLNIIIVFGYQGVQYTKHMRYFWSILPLLAVLAGAGWSNSTIDLRKIRHLIGVALIIILVSVWPLLFISIYQHPHSRIAASEWIYDHIASTKVLSAEHWDDSLPVCVPNKECAQYTHIEYPLYSPDSPEKWKDMYEKLSQTDYIILSSNRLYGSISWAYLRYPETTRFYRSLFANKLGFSRVVQFTSRPSFHIPHVRICIPVPWATYGANSHSAQQCDTDGISLIDDYADESFTVYDHPTVIIFQKNGPISYDEFMNTLQEDSEK
jgi:hypothetical protein